MFKKVDPKQSFPHLEEEVLTFWEKNKTFEKSIDSRPEKNEFVFYDGPPFATGLPHYGTLLASIIKDVFPRYKTMQGYRVYRRFGWDCHGLPVENLVEKEIGITSKKEILAYGIDKFNDACRAVVMRYVTDWEKYITRVGRWVDFKNNYKTMDLSYMESVVWAFKKLYERDLIYKSLRTSFYCTHCETPLSNFEISMDNSYKMIQDPSVTVKFAVAKAQPEANIEADGKTFVLAWTTTPWTLPANVAVAVKPDIHYVQVQVGEEKYILAKERLAAYEKLFGEYVVLNEFHGKALVGLTYAPLFTEYVDEVKTFRVIEGDFVSTEDGTGVVHIAPAFGEDDFKVGQKFGLALHVNPLASNGTFTKVLPKYEGMYYKDANKVILQDLKEANKVLDAKTIDHSVGICWRCKTPLIYMTQEAWFVKVSHIKEEAIRQNEKINWFPEHLKHGRFEKGLETAPDWNITRNRFWGAPIPIWKCEECHEQVVFGSLAEIEKASGKKVEDLHRPAIDQVTVPCSNCGKTMRRVPEVLDCWFESGSMPFAVPHYPFENKKWFENNFPADFIAEYIGQVRGWYYALHVLSTALFKKPAFTNSVTTGNVLGTDGFKMSKSRNNYPDPFLVFNKYGADALRFYLMASPVMRAENNNFSERGVEEVVRAVLLPMWNSYSFFVTYANIDGWAPAKKRLKKTNALDQWMLSELAEFVSEATEAFEAYDTVAACAHITTFTDKLTNWYIRRSRRRFWKSEDDADKEQAYDTLHEVLVTLAHVVAPIMPFVAEHIYQNLTEGTSVHLSDWPRANKKAINEKLNKEMNTVRLVVTLGLGARAKAQIKVRQPLAKLTMSGSAEEARLIEKNKDIILSELNVKELAVQDHAPDSVVMKLSPLARVLGPKYGGDVQHIIRAAKAGNFEVTKNGFVVSNEKQSWNLLEDEAELVYESKEGQAVEASAGVVVALDVNISPALRQEGIARDIVRAVQDLRKEAKLDVSDRIRVVVITENQEIQSAIDACAPYIQEETLATSLVDKVENPIARTQVTLEGSVVTIALSKA